MVSALLLAVLLNAVTIRELTTHASVAGERVCAGGPVRTFYQRRDFAPVWDDELIAGLADAVRHAEEDGLAPEDYHLQALTTLQGEEREVVASDAFLLLAGHLVNGRVDPRSLQPNWCFTPKTIDVAAVLQSAIDARDVAGALARLRPRHAQYAKLREALATYRAIERGGEWPAVPAPKRVWRRGDRDPRIVALRSRLAKEPWAQLADSGSDLFDDDLVTTVKHFQTHHGLGADGVVGKATVRELNVPAASRVGQLAVALERWRWMPEDLGTMHAIVNIAAFRLEVIKNDRTADQMRTVVGKAFTKTPFISSRIVEVILNPPWNVPDKIAREELWPKQQRDSGYFAREHIVVLKSGRLQQLAGPWCSLGRIKFNIPNEYGVYLHDTPAKTLFDQDVRAFSHGCIRIERPLDLARILLPDWPLERMQSVIVSGKEVTIRVAKPLPVYVLYWTSWVDDDGHVEFRPDIYGRDAAITGRQGSP